MFKSIGHSLKNLDHSQKLFDPQVSQAGYVPACLFHSLIVNAQLTGGKGASHATGKLNVKTGPPLLDILIFGII